MKPSKGIKLCKQVHLLIFFFGRLKLDRTMRVRGPISPSIDAAFVCFEEIEEDVTPEHA